MTPHHHNDLRRNLGRRVRAMEVMRAREAARKRIVLFNRYRHVYPDGPEREFLRRLRVKACRLTNRAEWLDYLLGRPS